MGHGRDRRNAKRVGYVCQVECETDSEAESGASVSISQTTRICDLSLSGAFIDSTTSFAPGTILKLAFDAGGATITASAEVRYTIPQIGMGVRFIDLMPEQTAALERLIGAEPRSAPADEWPHGSNGNSGQPDQKLFLGSFNVISLFDVIQMIENSRLTGVLKVMLPYVKGEVYFKEGEIAGAATDGESGAEALSRFLNAADGTFEFKKSTAQFERTILAPSNIGLLLDLLREKDEEAALH